MEKKKGLALSSFPVHEILKKTKYFRLFTVIQICPEQFYLF
jgi:hypothetical protein